MFEIGKTQIPAVGFGTFPLKSSQAQNAVEMAFDVGYRHIDTAQMYGNEKDVGEAIRFSGLSREDFIITTKIDPLNVVPERFLASVERSLKDLRLFYVDYLLLHWPINSKSQIQPLELLMEAKRRGYAKHIGVSNFTCSQLKEAESEFPGLISINQIEFHPLLDQRLLQNACSDLGISLGGYCALARGAFMNNEVLDSIAHSYGKSVPQVALRWIIQQGVAAVAMSTKESNARANLDIFDFELSENEMNTIGLLRKANKRVVSPRELSPVWDAPIVKIE
ncbi:aldo/keto reductase [Nitrincola sp.]|uniref:aldo/keto reductase n=1 Tax=Nitrincola sp. TaxID=1926584 RepID=UPI003A8DB4AE